MRPDGEDVTTADLTLLEKAALLTGKTVWESYDLPRHQVRSLWLADGPHGVRKQLGAADHLGIATSEPATCFPTSAAVANTWDVDLAERVGAALGAEAAAQGVDVLLGPGLNVKRSPLGGRDFEYFSEDPLLSGRMAAGFVRGIQSQGVAACPKHYAANSQEMRRMVSDSVVDERTLREIYLTAFGIVVAEARPRTIMTSYNLVNGVYANECPFLLTQVLREEWGFDGAVVTDWGGSNDIVAGVAAGSTLEMPSAGLDSARQLVQAVRTGRLAEADLDARAAEMLRLVADARGEAGPAVDPAEQHALAREVAARSAVLLKNDEAVLPLAAGARVAVIGDFARTPRYQGSGSSVVNPTRLDTVLDVIGESGLEMTAFAAGFRRDGTPDAQLRAEAVQAARGADVALLFLGLDEVAESEGMDRTTLALHESQVETLHAVAAVNPRTVVVLAGGGVVEMPWLASAQAVLHGHLAGQAGAGGLLDVLTGTVNPAGHLAETIPVALSDTPTARRFPASGRAAEYREGLYVGYRYYTTADVPVAFPFGYGLSYTTFAHTDLVATPEAATVTVTNTGQVAGADVVQVYVSRTGDDGVHRPVRTLAGFARVELEPGESATVTVPLGDAAFRHWDVAAGAWQVERGTWRVLAGADVEDLPLSAEVEVDGVAPRREADLPDRYRTADVQRVPDEDFAALLGRGASAWASSSAATGPLTPADPLSEMSRARSPLARLAYRVMARRQAAADRRGAPDLNILFLLNMPFRTIGKMTNGMVSAEMVDGIVRIVNGRFFAGAGATIGAFFRNRRANKASARALLAPGPDA